MNPVRNRLFGLKCLDNVKRGGSTVYETDGNERPFFIYEKHTKVGPGLSLWMGVYFPRRVGRMQKKTSRA